MVYTSSGRELTGIVIDCIDSCFRGDRMQLPGLPICMVGAISRVWTLLALRSMVPWTMCWHYISACIVCGLYWAVWYYTVPKPTVHYYDLPREFAQLNCHKELELDQLNCMVQYNELTGTDTRGATPNPDPQYRGYSPGHFWPPKLLVLHPPLTTKNLGSVSELWTGILVCMVCMHIDLAHWADTFITRCADTVCTLS